MMSPASSAASQPPAATLPADPMQPDIALVRGVEPEAPGVATFRLELQDPQRQAAYRFAPGQFNMLLIPGVGEVAISIAGGADEGAGIAHTIRFVGLVTRVIEQLQPGDRIGLRGPYGTGWPLPLARGQDVLIVAGGLGLPPLRPALRALLQNREQYGRLMLLYGARSPADLMYPREYAEWERRGVELLVTVDHADESWSGRVGVVPALLKHLALAPERTIAFTCGPEIMMRFAARDLLARGLPASRLFLSIERNMQCGIGLCGRCQIGPYFVCKDGPVMSYDRIGRFVTQEHF